MNTIPTKICVKCHIEKSLDAFGTENPYRAKQNKRVPHKRNDCKTCRQIYRKRRAALPHSKHLKKLNGIKYRYSLDAESYLDMVEKQENLCAICQKFPGNKGLAVDHNHDTGKIRGLLCDKCNMGLGLLGDNISTLEAALNYLKIYDSVMRQPRNLKSNIRIR